MQIIGLVGRAGSGKSTVAKHLICRHGFAPGKFARALKLMLRTLLLYRGAAETEIDQMIEGDLKEVPSLYLAGKTPRHAMQSLGTEWGRDCIGPDFWVETEGDHLNLAPGCPRDYRPARIVFDDVRFPNEEAFIRRMGGEIWDIRRPVSWLSASAAAHSSEQQTTRPDRIVLNDGSLAALEAAVAEELASSLRSARA